MPDIKEPSLIGIDRLVPNEWNPNEQSEEVFNQLMKEIEEDGFEHPLVVVPHSEVEGDYTIIGGEHRWRAAMLLGMEEVPCVIHDDWDMETQKLKTVRRNLLSGNLNARKFTDLVNDLTQTGMEMDDMPVMMGFEDKKEMEKHLIKESAKGDKFVDDMKEPKAEVKGTESLMSIVASIFKDANGAVTVDQSYLFFTVKGKTQMAIMCEDDTWETVEGMVAHLKDSGQDAATFIKEAIAAKLT